MYQIIQKRKFFLGISLALTSLAVIALAVWGLNYGIDFTGGSLMEIKFKQSRPSVSDMEKAISSLDVGNLTIQPVGEDGMILRFKDVNEEKHQKILAKIRELAAPKKDDKNAKNSQPAAGDLVEQLRFDSIGPSIGQELKSKSFNAMFFVVLGIVIYISWSFRLVSKPVVSWKYGVAAIVALIHDVTIAIGAFAVFGHFFGMAVNTPFVAAVLTVLGYSVNDTIVVFDRIRENLPKSHEDFENTVNISINQTLARSINTSGTVMLVLLAITIFGGASIRDFSLALLIGVFAGTYSSIFIASPILVIWEKYQRKS